MNEMCTVYRTPYSDSPVIATSYREQPSQAGR